MENKKDSYCPAKEKYGCFATTIDGEIKVSDCIDIDTCPASSKKRIRMMPIETVWLPRPSAKYPGCYPLGFENKVIELLGTKNYVHFFSGKAKTGYRIDINAETNPDLIANVESLPTIPDNSFDGALADPPYTEEFAKNLYKVPYPKWSLWTSELVRIVKPGSKIAIMQNYVVPRLPNCKFSKILVIITRIKQYPKIVTIQEKQIHA